MPIVIHPNKTRAEQENGKQGFKQRYAQWVDWNCSAVGWGAVVLLLLDLNLLNKLIHAFAVGATWTERVQINMGSRHPLYVPLSLALVIGAVETVCLLIAAFSWVALKAGWLCCSQNDESSPGS